MDYLQITDQKLARIAGQNFAKYRNIEPSDWYVSAHSWVKALAEKHQVSVKVVAGITAVISPMTKWEVNQRNTEMILQGGRGKMSGIPHNFQKAYTILEGVNPDEIVSGKKVNAFYRNLCGDFDAITIDIWMVRVALNNLELTDTNTVTYFMKPKRQQILINAFQRYADRIGTPAAHLQAAIWESVRNS